MSEVHGDAGISLFSGDKAVPVHIRHSHRARRLRMQVDGDGVSLVIPPGLSEKDAAEFLQQHRDWVIRKYRSFAEQRRRLPQVEPDAMIPYRGGVLRLSPLQEAGDTAWRHDAENGELRLRWLGDDNVVATCALIFWYGEQANQTACSFLRYWTDELALYPERVSLRDLRSRWGSCSSRGRISLNWRLIMAPDDVFEYVIVHELCHLVVARHDREFWAHVESRLPDAAGSRHWLRTNGNELLDFLPDLRLRGQQLNWRRKPQTLDS